MPILFSQDPQSPLPPDPAQEGEATDEQRVAQEVSATLESLLPWGISFLFHVGLVLLAFFLIWSTAPQIEDEDTVVPVLSYTETPQPVQVQQQQQVQRQVQQRTLSPIRVVSPSPSISTTPVGAGELANLSPPAPSSLFQGSVGEDQAFDVRFFSKGNARRVAFLIDASGSLTDSIPFVISHLKDTINRLSDKQEFTVIFFQGSDVVEMPRRRLLKATRANKDLALEWIDTNRPVTGSSSDPIAAIERALRYRPQLLFLLSDNITNTGLGQFEVPQWKLMEALSKVNLGQTKINTIQFIYPDQLDSTPGRTGTMKLIAQSTGGRYTFVSERDLGIE